jgi:ferrous iron transport protein B
LAKSEPILHKNKVAIIGNPNVGKSALFNHITKSYSLVSNFPYTTIAVSRAFISIGGNQFEIIDTPGIMSLNIQSEDGLVTSNILIREHPEIIILCLDTNNFKRSLLLVCQIFELNIPVIVCLNIVDESRQKGITIRREKLEELLGVPVVETVATEGRGIRELLKQLQKSIIPGKQVQYKSFIEKGIVELLHCFPLDSKPSLAIIMLLLQQDPEIEKFIQSKYGPEISTKVSTIAEGIQKLTGKPLTRIILEARDRWAEKIVQDTTERQLALVGRVGEIVGAWCRHPLLGWVVLLGIIYGTYLIVGRVGSEILATYFDEKIFAPINSTIGKFIPWDFAREFAVGDFGILTTGLANAIGTVMPILALFFLILNFLEDSGYIANLCVLTNRLFQRVGLSGKAILPIVLGFGCKTMATLTTKILESKKERQIAIFLIAFAIPCSPLIGVNLAILALFPFKAFLIVFGILLATEIIAGLSLNKILKEDIVTDFILEIPPIRFPSFKNLMIKTYHRTKWFLVEAVPLFMIGAFFLFLLDKLYVLQAIKKFIFPVIVSFLNLPIVLVDAFLLSLARKEAGAVILLDLAKNDQLDYIQALVGIIVVTCFFPCFANTMSMIKVLGLKSALVMTLVIAVFSVIIGGIVNLILRTL